MSPIWCWLRDWSVHCSKLTHRVFFFFYHFEYVNGTLQFHNYHTIGPYFTTHKCHEHTVCEMALLSSVLDSWLFFLTFVVFFSCLWLFSPSLLVFTLPIHLPQEGWVCVVCGRGRKMKGEREEETNLSLPETNYRELNILQLTNELCSKLWPPDKIYHTIFSLEPVQIFFTFYLTHSQCNWLLVHMKCRWLSYLV